MNNRRNATAFTTVIAGLLCGFTLQEVNWPLLSPQSQLALFALFGLLLCFSTVPVSKRLAASRMARRVDILLAVMSVVCCGYVIVHTEPLFRSWWPSGNSLGNRAGSETAVDLAVGVMGLLLVLESARRSIGMALPVLSVVFLAYAFFGGLMPGGFFAHRGYSLERVVSQTFLQSQGVFGVALKVMFTYVFLFVIFGAFLKATGATGFIIDFARHVFRNSPGGPAKVAVLSSGLMGSLSGSAVANTATTGTFTIPMMRASGYRAVTAAGIEAAASTGGALVPPVMGAAAYMMLEIVNPPVTFLQIISAALIPALLYYLSLFLIVHFLSKSLAVETPAAPAADAPPPSPLRSNFSGIVFLAAFASLIFFLVMGYSAFRAVSLSLIVIVAVAAFNKTSRLTLRGLHEAIKDSARDVIPLIAAAACVGIVIGVVTLTGVGNKFPALILPLAEGNLFLALLLIMFCSMVLGMGLPSAVCYLLMATLIGPVLGNLGVVPLAAHLFIFYFGMMSMVTPPVALAAYAAGSIAGSPIMATSMAAFRFALAGFTLPYLFVFRPELLMLAHDGSAASWPDIAYVTAIAALGVCAFAAGLAGHLFAPLSRLCRALLFLGAALLAFPGREHVFEFLPIPLHDLAGGVLVALLFALNWRGRAVQKSAD